ncbi:MAG: ATP synthase F1 subunit gamma [Nitrospirota bacterium]
MPTLRDIKRRIKAVSNTRQITKAMKMVAAAKLRKSQSRMFELRPYAEKMEDVLSSLASGADSTLHPLLTARPRKTVEVLVITSDRGLCGAFNNNILKTAAGVISGLKKDWFDVTITAIGKKAIDYFKRRNVPLRRTWAGLSGRVTYASAQEVTNDIIENYIGETFDEVLLIHNEFLSVMAQKVTKVKLLPLVGTGDDSAPQASVDFLYEPSQEDIYQVLLPKKVGIQIYRALLESQASEEGARMTAMGNATKNADEMIDRLTLQYNKARQATITRELMDIVGGVEALK